MAPKNLISGINSLLHSKMCIEQILCAISKVIMEPTKEKKPDMHKCPPIKNHILIYEYIVWI